MAGNQTLAIIKPDAISSGKLGPIITHIEEAGFRIIGVDKVGADYELTATSASLASPVNTTCASGSASSSLRASSP